MLDILLIGAYIYFGRKLFRALSRCTNNNLRFFYKVAYLFPGIAIILILLIQVSGLDAGNSPGAGLFTGIVGNFVIAVGFMIFCINGMVHLFSKRSKKNNTLTDSNDK